MPKPHRTAPAVALAIASVLGPATARAQLPQPALGSVFPAGGRAGEAATIQPLGTNLEGAEGLWFDHPGIRAFRLKGGAFAVAIAPDVPVGLHDVRVLGPLGVSNPRAFAVGDRPEAEEVEPNDTPTTATPLPLNSTVNGRSQTPADVDCFAFEGKAGQKLILDVAAERIDSPMDATLRVYGPNGAPLAESQDDRGSDPVVELTLPADGRYVAKVHDVTYAGTPGHAYRLTFHDGPLPEAIVPASAPPGAASTFTLLGRNLGPGSSPGRPEQKPLAITSTTAPLAPGLEFVPSWAASRLGMPVRLAGPSGLSEPVFLAEATDPVVLEREPNDDEAHAQEVTPPCDLTGTFGARGDVDIYRFRATKGAVWWVEATAHRLGSQADPAFVIQKVPEKGPATDLTAGDDLPDPGFGPRFSAASVDAAVRWVAPEDGLYQVVINDLYNSQRGDPRLVYRLNIRPERPDFRLYVVPDPAQAPAALTLRAGGRATATLLLARLDGFAGSILVEPRDLPPGVTCDPVAIGPGQLSAPIVFTAAENAGPIAGVIRLVGRAEGEGPTIPKLEREALAGAMTRAPIPNPNGGPPPPSTARLARGLVVAIRDLPGVRLSAKPARFVVGQGHQLPLDLELTRSPGVVEPVSVAVTDLPPTMTAPAAVTIAKDANTASLPMYLPKTVPPGTYTFVLRGTGPVPFNKDPNAKDRPNVAVTSPSNAITVTVRPAPVALALNAKGGAVKQGETLEIEVAVNRQMGFAGEVTLTLAAPAALKLSADPVVVPADAKAAKLTLRAAADSPPGAAAGLAVRATSPVAGVAVEIDEPLAATIQAR